MSKTRSADGAQQKRGAKAEMSVCYLVAGVVLTLVVGMLVGVARYWYGFFVLGQGVIVGLFIPWASNLLCSGSTKPGKMVKSPRPLMFVLILFACFMVTQLVGYGVAQPWFDPMGWVGRVVQQRTKEAVWGVSLLGGSVGRNFRLGINGGFWVFLNVFDQFFMLFLLLVGVNSRQEAKR